MIRFRAATRTLREEDAGDTLDRIASGETLRCLLAWISLMRGGGESAIIERWKLVAYASLLRKPDSWPVRPSGQGGSHRSKRSWIT